jgi:hypothetical protein
MPISTGNFAKALWPGINAWYGKEYAEHKTEWTELFDQFKSRRAWEEDVGYTGFGLPVIKGEGETITYDVQRQGFVNRYTHVVYALGFIITREMFEDDLYDIVGEKRARGLAFSLRQGKEILAANVYNRAFNSTYTFGDGKELLATDHPNVGGGTYANELTTAADLSEASLVQACIDLMKFTDDRGMKIKVMPKKLIIPVDLWPDTERLLETQYEVGTGNNTVNIVYKKMPYVVNHYLTDTDAWFIRTDVKDGLKYFERRGDSFDMDNDFDTENAKFKASFRCSFGATNPKALFGSPGA